MLSGRARPPPAKDFIDIFQKFKLAFNLLARVKPYIHDPNAPELVHFLFTPLSLVVEASRDPRSNTPDLPARVVAPMLTADAKELLVNCLTTKEMELWRSLGDTWTISRYALAFGPKISLELYLISSTYHPIWIFHPQDISIYSLSSTQHFYL